jgi:chromosome segregation ATPase
MATSKSCSKCKKGKGAYFCIGCEEYFCKKDYHEHREKMANKLEGFIGDRNGLHVKINNITQQKDFRSPLLTQIDEWETATIRKVKEVAQKARQQVEKLLNGKKLEIKAQFEKFSQELVELKETEDFVENDLKRLEQTIQQLNQDLQKLSEASAIEVRTEQSKQIAWDSLIYVEEKVAYDTKQQYKQRVMGESINRFGFYYIHIALSFV